MLNRKGERGFFLGLVHRCEREKIRGFADLHRLIEYQQYGVVGFDPLLVIGGNVTGQGGTGEAVLTPDALP